MNNNEDFASFAIRLISTLRKISGYLKGIFIHKLTQYYKLYVYLTYLYILAEISACHLQLKCVGGHFFSGPSLDIESTTVLSDKYIVHVHVCTQSPIKQTSRPAERLKGAQRSAPKFLAH